MHPEEPPQPPTIPDQGVERRDESARLDGARRLDAGKGVRLLLPAVHARGHEPSLLHQLGQEPRGDRLRALADRASPAPRHGPAAIAPAVDVEVAGEIVQRSYATGPRCAADELLHRLLARRRRRFACLPRNDALGEVVEPLEAAPAGDGEEPGVEEMLEGFLAAAPTPPVARALAGAGEVSGSDWSALGHLRIDLRHVDAAPRAHVSLRPLRVLG